MATEHLFYTVSHRADGWHAGPVGHPGERVFSTKAAALLWCKAQAQSHLMAGDADPDVEIRTRE